MKQYFSLLDPLRFFAAVWVMNYHYLLGNGANPPLHWYRFGNLGVQIFFVISGFVIIQSVQGKSSREFATGRFLRLFPLFWVLCTGTYLLTIFFPDPSYTIHFSDYLRSMTMLSDSFQHFLGSSTLVDSSYWTLTVELIFYLMIGAFVHFFGHKRLPPFFLLFLGISIVTFALHKENEYWASLLLVRYAAYFVFGGVLSLIMTQYHKGTWGNSLYFALLGVTAAYAVLIRQRAIFPYETPNVHDDAVIVAIHIAIFVSIICLVYLSRFVTNMRVIKTLGLVGALTYPLYLLHQRIGNILIDLLIHHGPFAWLSIVIGMEVFMIVCALVLARLDKTVRRFLTGSTSGICVAVPVGPSALPEQAPAN